MFKKSVWIHVASMWVITLWLLSGSLQAQNVTGTLTGTVADPTGAIVPGATVVMRNDASGDERRTVTNNDGFFSINAVQPGDYTVTIQAAGFQRWQQGKVHFDAGDKRNLSNISLAVGAASDTVTVSGSAEALTPVDSGEKSIVIGQQQLQNIAIQGQNAAEFIKILPGFAMTGGTTNAGYDGQQQSTGAGPVGSFSANGLRTAALDITSDGAHTIDPGCNCGQAVNTVTDMTSELKVLTSNFGAENSKGPVVIAAVGKSGGNQFHGEAYIYARNNIFDATNSFNNSEGTNEATGLKVAPKPPTYFYYPGANIGGPVLIPGTRFNHNHDKLFFFFAYEDYTQQVQDVNHDQFASVVPTAAMRAGNFSQAQLNADFAGNPTAQGYSLGPVVTSKNNNLGDVSSGIIPASMFSPIGVNQLKLYPMPNVNPGQNNGYNYIFNTTHSDNMWQIRPRIDWSINDNTKLFVSYNVQREVNHDNSTLWWGTNPAVPYPSAQNQPNTSDSISANLTKVFSPTLTNELVFTYTNLYVAFQYANPEKVNAQNLGIAFQHVFNKTVNNQVPVMTGWSDGLANILNPSGYEKNNTLYADKWLPTLSDNISKVWGTHTAKFGFYWERTKNEQPSDSYVNGEMQYANWGTGSTGNAYADMLTGIISGGYAETNFDPVIAMHYTSIDFYAQDSWKVSRRLTLDYGMRFDHLSPWIDETGIGAAIFNPSAYDPTAAPTALTGFQWHKQNGSVPVTGTPSRFLFYEPRAGFAYDIFGSGKTVVRGGYGMYRYHDEQNVQAGALSIATGQYTYNSAPPSGSPTTIGYLASVTPSLILPGSINTLDPRDSEMPETQSYSFTVSQRVPWASTAEFSYVGNTASYLNNWNNNLGGLNNIAAGTLFSHPEIFGTLSTPISNPNITAFRPYQSYGTIHEVNHNQYSNYNAFQASWNKQTGHLTWLLNYTFSKSLGIRGEGGNGGVGDPVNIKNDYGVLPNDRTHLFNVAYVAQLGSPMHSNFLAKGVINGWKISGITQFQSGIPLQDATGNSNFGLSGTVLPGDVLPNGYVVKPGDNFGLNSTLITGSPDVSVQPVLTCDPRKNLAKGQYINGACFAAPTVGHNGSFVFPYIKGPAFINNDLSLFKSFQISESKKLEFRASAYNFLNHPLATFNPTGAGTALQLNLNAQGKVASNSNFGYANYFNGNRTIQLVLKFYF